MFFKAGVLSIFPRTLLVIRKRRRPALGRSPSLATVSASQRHCCALSNASFGGEASSAQVRPL